MLYESACRVNCDRNRKKKTKIADGGKFIDGSQDRKQKVFIRMIFLSKLFFFVKFKF